MDQPVPGFGPRADDKLQDSGTLYADLAADNPSAPAGEKSVASADPERPAALAVAEQISAEHRDDVLARYYRLLVDVAGGDDDEVDLAPQIVTVVEAAGKTLEEFEADLGVCCEWLRTRELAATLSEVKSREREMQESLRTAAREADEARRKAKAAERDLQKKQTAVQRVLDKLERLRGDDLSRVTDAAARLGAEEFLPFTRFLCDEREVRLRDGIRDLREKWIASNATILELRPQVETLRQQIRGHEQRLHHVTQPLAGNVAGDERERRVLAMEQEARELELTIERERPELAQLERKLADAESDAEALMDEWRSSDSQLTQVVCKESESP